MHINSALPPCITQIDVYRSCSNDTEPTEMNFKISGPNTQTPASRSVKIQKIIDLLGKGAQTVWGKSFQESSFVRSHNISAQGSFQGTYRVTVTFFHVSVHPHSLIHKPTHLPSCLPCCPHFHFHFLNTLHPHNPWQVSCQSANQDQKKASKTFFGEKTEECRKANNKPFQKKLEVDYGITT